MKRELIGAGLFGSCAFISTKIIGSFPPESRGRAIEAAAKHEIGHTLIDIDGHCPDGRCIMQANDGSIERFLEIARLGLDFCGPCTLAIGRGVRILEDGAITRGDRIPSSIRRRARSGKEVNPSRWTGISPCCRSSSGPDSPWLP